MSHAIEPLYVRYQVTDLEKMESFLRDFGMLRVQRDAARLFMRGTGSAPYVYEAVLGPEARFLGAGFRMAGHADLEQLAALEGSGRIESLADAPGGGHRVRMRMADGFEIDAVHGAASVARL